jgi:hydroxyacylglutathione hydrolase
MIIERFVNQILDSNCYLIIKKDCKNVIVVDPGDNDLRELINHLEINDLSVEYVIFTHEHYDHIAGGKLLKDKFDSKFIGSEECAEAIINPKKNLSIFYNDQPYISPDIDITIEKLSFLLVWNSFNLKFFSTPGHSKGSISFMIGNHIFTGDTLIKDIKTITNLPGGNKNSLEKSLELIRSNCNNDTMILPGHKNKFRYKELY